MMTRHFVWLVPLIDLVLFLGIGALLAMATRRWPRRAGWWSPRLIIALAILPALALAGRRIYVEAWALVALGVGFRAGPGARAAPGRRAGAGWWGPPRRCWGWSCSRRAGSSAASRSSDGASRAGPLPPAGSPNVLLIVLDTVRADRLSLYGYPRATTPNLERLAARGIRFDEARATAPWTLASHASFFTGRWPHELGVRWMAPLRGDFPTLAEYLGSRGYATAGFVANAGYCSYDTGLDRGFTHYRGLRPRCDPARSGPRAWSTPP